MVTQRRFTQEEKSQRMAAKGPGSVWITKDGFKRTIKRTFLDEIGIERVEWVECDSTPVWHTIWGHRSNMPFSVNGVPLPTPNTVDPSDSTYTIEAVEDDAPDTLDAALRLVRDALRGTEASTRRFQEAKAFREEARKLLSGLSGSDLQAARELLAEANEEYREAEELHLVAMVERRKIETILGVGMAA